MNIAIRYYSKFGHSKKMADVLAKVAGVDAGTVSVPSMRAIPTKKTFPN